ncbi:MAG TPA: single-stranded-DNA-specific exonuclease RecJ [Vicinamibacterales bacterium]|nr:single-stranded-DNA-specific exonuclease RecJ [Vicinamibacterales bacterium]
MPRPLIWEHQPHDEARSAALAAALGVHPVIAHLLCVRGLHEPEAAAHFLKPKLEDLHDPMRLAGLREAVVRLEEAIARAEPVAIHGDYDVDGITSTVILRRALELLGGRVAHFIPERMKHGYGLHVDAIERLAAEGVRVIVSVDCGIRGAEAARRARELGVDLIITDHHEPDGALPEALAVVNPKRHDCAYPFKDLAGVGVTLKLVQALCDRAGRSRWLPAFVKIAALGTLADVVPLVGENRVIARLGLEWLSRGPHTVGVRSLLEAAGLTGKRLGSFHVGFVLAPRINAAGRMSTAEIATRLLLLTDEAMAGEARDLASQLEVENQKRQQEEATILAEARQAIEGDPAIGAHNVLVVGAEGWHRGVIGIVASKLVETFYKPAIVLSIEGDIAHGSCRSIPAFNMLGALEQVHDLFIRFGGHRQAAGLTLEAARVPEFRARINAFADERLDPADLIPRLRIDAPLSLKAIGKDLLDGLQAMEPFGLCNSRPIFHATPVELAEAPRVVKDRHLSMAVRQDGRVFRAIAWRAAERMALLEQHRTNLALAFSLDRNEYQGETFLQLTVADIRPLEMLNAAPAEQGASVR